MKSKFILGITKTIVLVMLLMFTSNSCKKATEGVQLIFNTDVTDATVSIQFYDAATGVSIAKNTVGQEITIDIEGKDKNMVIDNAGSDNFKVLNGCITVGIKKGVEPSASNPIKFSIVAHGKGYLSTSVSVIITEKGTQHHQINLVDISNTPDGVGAVEDNSVSVNGSGISNSTVSISTPTLNTGFEQTKATVVIPAGTQLLDENFNPVTGTINTTLVYFNNQDEAALKSFPGGFSVTTDEFGDITFKTAGFIAMEMKNQSGKEVKHFSTPIQMKVEVPSATTNIDQVQITDGMTVPIWSYDPKTAKWEKESEQSILYNSGSGKYEVSFDMIHLSYWNLDWHYSSSCSLGAKISMLNSGANGSKAIFKMKYPNGQLIKTFYESIDNGYTIQFMNAPYNQALVLEAYIGDNCNSNSGTLIGSMTQSNWCSGAFNMNLNVPVSLVNPAVSLKMEAKCANRPGQIIKPSATIYAMDINDGCWNYLYLGEMVNGYISTNKLEQGKSYQFHAYFGGYWLESPQSYTIDKTEYVYDQTLPANLCNMFN